MNFEKISKNKFNESEDEVDKKDIQGMISEGLEKIEAEKNNSLERMEVNAKKAILADESFMEGEESVDLKKNLEIIKSLIDGFIEDIKNNKLNFEDLKEERAKLQSSLMNEKAEIVKGIKDEGLQKELFRRQFNSYTYLKHKALSFLGD